MASPRRFNFVDYLKGILERCYIFSEDIPPEHLLKFYHHFESLANIEADSFIFPAVYLEEPFQIKYVHQKSGAIFHEYTFTLIFMNKTNLEESADDYYKVALAFEDPIRQFVSKLKKFTLENGYDFAVNFEKSPIAFPFINAFDANVSGVIVDFVLTINHGTSIC